MFSQTQFGTGLMRKNSILKAAVIAAFAALFCIGCGDNGDDGDDDGNGGGGTKSPYTVTFDPNGGTVSPTSGKTGTDGKLDSLPTPTRDEYTFAGWYTADTGGTAVNTGTAFSANDTVYARWTANPVDPSAEYTLNIDINPVSGGSVDRKPSKTTYKAGDTVTVKATADAEYRFVRWTGVSTSKDTVITVIINANLELTANFELITYTITFDANGGTVNPRSGKTGTDGKLDSLPSPTRTDYAYNGWFTAETGGTLVTTSTVFSANTTIYAQWKQNIFITFDANGGTGTAPSARTVDAGTSITLPDQGSLARTGYTFAGWNTNSSGAGTNYNANNTYTPTATITLYAKWEWVGKGNNINNYKAISIGEQLWMTENLDYYVEGSKCYGNSADSCAKYGRLYNWSTAMTACPVGWHLPSDAEWGILVDYAGGSLTAGNKLKATSGWGNNDNGTDEYGFSALPGGYGYAASVVAWFDIGKAGSWWSATEISDTNAWYWRIGDGSGFVWRGDVFEKDWLMSVRCVAD